MAKTTPTYQTLFGTDNYYTVTDSRSVLSPAAYLVELLKLMHANIVVDEDSGGAGLDTRRPDIYNIVLDENNTLNELPRLDIVNKLLKKKIEETKKDSDMASLTYPFDLPYNEALHKIRQYLARNKQSLQELWKTFNTTYRQDTALSKAVALETLGLSPEHWAQYSTDPQSGQLYNYYGYAEGTTDEQVVSDLADVQTFLTQTGLDQDRLNELLYEDLSEDEINDTKNNYRGSFYINRENSDTPVSVSGNGINGLTVINAGRIMRFVRMAGAVGWSFTDLDWALQTISPFIGIADLISDQALPYLAWIGEQVQNRGLTVNQCCGFLRQIKDYGKKSGTTFYDSIFKNKKNPQLPSVSTGSYLTWNVPDPDSTTEPTAEDKQIESALSAALQLSQQDLVTAAVQVVLYANNKNYQLELNPANMALLYRMSLLPCVIEESLDDIFTACAILDKETGQLVTMLVSTSDLYSTTLNALSQINGLFLWLANSSLSTGQLEFITCGKSSDLAVQNSAISTDTTTNFLSQLRSDVSKLLVTQSVFYTGLQSDVLQLLKSLIQSEQFSRLFTPANNKSIEDVIATISLHAFEYCKTICNTMYDRLQEKDIISPQGTTALSLNNDMGTVITESFIDSLQSLGTLSVDRGFIRGFGLWRSTDGKTWTQLPDSSFPADAGVQCLICCNNIYFAGTNARGLWTSTDGQTWKQLPDASFPADVVITCLADFNNAYLAGTAAQGLWRSTDGQTWTQFTDGFFPADTGVQCLADLNNTYLAGTAAQGLWRSTDGQTWTQLPDGSFPADAGVQCLADFNKIYFAGTHVRGLWTSTDGQTWKQLPESSFPADAGVQCLADLNNVCFAGTVARGLWRSTDGQTWKQLPDESFPADADVQCLAACNNTYIAGTAARGLWTSTDGTTWIQLSDGSFPADSGIACLECVNSTCFAGMSLLPGSLVKNQFDVSTKNLADYLTSSNRKQQKVFIHTLSGLYHTTTAIAEVLRKWGDLNLEDLVGDASLTQQQAGGILAMMVSYNMSAIENREDSMVQVLQKLEQAALLITKLSLSPAESDFFKTMYTPTAGYPIVYDSVKEIAAFKGLVKTFGDSQNNLLNIVRGSVANWQAALAKLTAWDADELKKMCDEDHLNITTPAIDAIVTLNQYFSIAKTAGIKAGSLWKLRNNGFLSAQTGKSAVKSDSEDNAQTLAAVLWGGLKACFKDSPAVLTKIENRVNEKLRDKLVSLSCFLLKNQLAYYGVSARGLYAYLLIDVEVSGVVETSYIVEAISAVQLYIYRCLNQLEPGTSVKENSDLPALWQWMQSYREWQANREVFLWPENYVEPELRDEKTVLFKNAEHALKQADLTNLDAVESVFRDYMNGLETVGNLTIISGGVRTYSTEDVDNTRYIKEYCFVGAGPSGHGKYYYRLATFSKTEEDAAYTPFDWGQWQKIDLTINPIEIQDGQYGAPKPVFAFGRWYVFWAELQQSGGTTSPSGDKTSYYNNLIKYSYLDFNRKWISTQPLYSVGLFSNSSSGGDVNYSPHVCSDIPTWSTSIYCFTEFEGNIYTGTGNGLFIYQHYNWSKVEAFEERTIFSLKVYNKKIYVGTNNGLFTIASNDKWTQIGENNAPGKTDFVLSIQIFNNELYCSACFPTFIHGRLYKLGADGTWSCIDNGNFHDSFIGCLSVYNDYLYVGSAIGLFSIDVHGHWEQIDKNNAPPKNSEVLCIANFDGELYVSVGNNLYKMGIDGVWCCIDSPSNNSSLIYIIINNNSLYVVTNFYGELYKFNTNGQWTKEDNLFPDLKNAGRIWYKIINGIMYIGCMNTFTLYSTDSQLLLEYNSLPLAMNGSTAVLSEGETFETIIVSADGFNKISIGETSYQLTSDDIGQLSAYLNGPGGIDTLLASATQALVDFSDQNAMSVYYWELFFHLPFLIASELGKEQHFANAKKWYEYIFNPLVTTTGITDNNTYWQFAGLKTDGTRPNRTLAKELGEDEYTELYEDLNNTTELYVSDTDPFDPHAIARQRPIAYQKTIVMHYINNLLNWGDLLYCENTRESINEAEMLYVLAYNLLGEKPKNLGVEPISNPDVFNNIFAGVNTITEYTVHPGNILENKSLLCFKYYNNSIFIGTDSGLYQLENGIVSFINDLGTRAVRALEVFNETLYIGTESGLFTLKDMKNSIKYNDHDLEIHSFAVFSEIYLFCESYHQFGLLALVDNKLEYVNLTAPHEGNNVNSVCVLNDLVYVADQAIGLFFFAKSAFPPSDNKEIATVAVKLPGSDDRSYDPCYFQKFNNKLYFYNTMGEKVYAVRYGATVAENIAVLDGQGKTVTAISDAHFLSYHGILLAYINYGIYVLIDGVFKPVTQAQKIIGNDKIIGLGNIGIDCYVGTTEGKIYAIEPYFGIPRNGQFLSYWDEVQQRIYNIRHGLTINGQTDDLPLFSPPINPMDMVEAVASGESLTEAVNSLNSAVPYYRFEVMIEKAKAVTGSVIALGQSLLSALQSRDAQKLAELYNKNERQMSSLTQTAKQDSLNYMQQTVEALKQGLVSAQNRYDHYSGLVKAGWSAGETSQVTLAGSAVTALACTEAIRTAAILGYSVPTIFGFSDGGCHPGDAINQGAAIADGVNNMLNQSSNLAGIIAGYQRRKEEWQLQEQLAQDDINQVRFQIVAARYQQDQAEQEIILLQKQAEQQKKVAEFYKSKFTSEQLYSWYIGQLSGLYFQAYQLALDLALQAENAWRFEHIGLPLTSGENSFIKPSYWNSLYEGLLSGESLQLDLQHMEQAYMNQNVRRFEITKTISLAQYNSGALNDLVTNGSCTFDITENSFAWDYPGHYCRKIKSISVSIPAVVGPYQDIHATLTQTCNKLVNSCKKDGQRAVQYLLDAKKYPLPATNTALQSNLIPSQQIVLSQGINDTGMFELNFNDPRYLPFEGTGAVSSWQLDMPEAENDIHYKSISDVIISIKYTALQGSSEYKKVVEDSRSKK